MIPAKRKKIEKGKLVEIAPLKHPNVVKLYKKLSTLKTNPFMQLDKVLIVEPEDKPFVTMVTDVSCFGGSKTIEAVQIIYDESVYWMFCYDISRVYPKRSVGVS